MKKIVLFNTPIIIPVDKTSKVKTYGLVISLDSWMRARSALKTDYIRYVLVIAELYKDGFTSYKGEEFKKEGVKLYYKDNLWDEYEKRVNDSDIEYAIVEEVVKMNENDYCEEFLTSKEMWNELIREGGLKWQK